MLVTVTGIGGLSDNVLGPELQESDTGSGAGEEVKAGVTAPELIFAVPVLVAVAAATTGGAAAAISALSEMATRKPAAAAAEGRTRKLSLVAGNTERSNFTPSIVCGKVAKVDIAPSDRRVTSLLLPSYWTLLSLIVCLPTSVTAADRT